MWGRPMRCDRATECDEPAANTCKVACRPMRGLSVIHEEVRGEAGSREMEAVWGGRLLQWDVMEDKGR